MNRSRAVSAALTEQVVVGEYFISGTLIFSIEFQNTELTIRCHDEYPNALIMLH